MCPWRTGSRSASSPATEASYSPSPCTRIGSSQAWAAGGIALLAAPQPITAAALLGQALQVSGCGRSRPKGRLRCGREARLKSPILRFTATGSDDRCIRVWRMGSAGASQRGDWECERTLTGHNGGVVGVCFIQGVPPPRAPRRPAAPPPSRCASCTPRDTASHHGHGSARPHLSRKWHDLRPTST